jgi:hypothetical protein
VLYPKAFRRRYQEEMRRDFWERDAHLQGVWRSRVRDLSEDLFLRVRGRFSPEGLQSARATARIQYEYGPSSERVDTLGYQDGSISTRGRDCGLRPCGEPEEEDE